MERLRANRAFGMVAITGIVVLIVAACGGGDPTPVPPTPQPTATALTLPPTATALTLPPTATALTLPPTATPQPTPTPAPTPATPLTAADVEGIVKRLLPTATSVPTSPPTGPVRGGTLTVLGYSIGGFDPHVGGSVLEASAVGPLYNNLVQYDPLNPTEIVGDLAQSWELSSDGRTYTFVLNDAKWSDGQNVTGADGAFSIDRMLDPDPQKPRAGRIATYVESTEVVDEKTFKLNMQFPQATLLQLLGIEYMKVVPKHVLEAGVDIANADNVVGSGPFLLESFQQGSQYTFERNPDYFKDGRPYLDSIEAIVISDAGSVIAAFKTERILGQLAWTNQLTVDDVRALEGDRSFTSKFNIYWPSSGGDYYFVNATKPPFDDVRVRRAFFLATDRQELALGFGGGLYSAGTLTGKDDLYALPQAELDSTPGYRQLIGKKHPEDIAEAQRLMAEAGYPNGEGFEATFKVATIDYWADAALVIADQMKRYLNVDVEVRTQDIGTFIGDALSGDFQIGMLGYGPLVNDPNDRFGALYVPGGRNWTGQSDPEVTALFEQQEQELDTDKRRELAFEMQRKVLAGGPGHIETVERPLGVIWTTRIRTDAGGYVIAAAQASAMKHEHEWLAPD